MVAWANGSSVVVLAAGATRGAEFVGKNPHSPALSPLNADFFTQLEQVQAKNRHADLDAVLTVRKLTRGIPTMAQKFAKLGEGRTEPEA